MAYDAAFAQRVRSCVAATGDHAERKMFGGLAFMINGSMACGVLGDELVVRLGNDGASVALERPHTRPMDFTGRVIRSMLFVEARGTRTDAQLQAWVDEAAAFARTLPPK